MCLTFVSKEQSASRTVLFKKERNKEKRKEGEKGSKDGRIEEKFINLFLGGGDGSRSCFKGLLSTC